MLIYKFNDPEGLFVSITDEATGQGGVMSTSKVDLTGVSVLPYRTDEELREEALSEADSLYNNIKDNLIVVVDSLRFEMRDRFEFDYQKRGGGGARVRQVGGAIVSVGPALANSIETEASARLNALADAFNADVIAMESGDYSLSNLKIKESENEGG